MPSSSYVFFDFDKTLICKDSFKLLFSYLIKKSPYKAINLLLFLPVFILLFFFVEKRKLLKSYLLWTLIFFGSQKSILKNLNYFGTAQKNIWFQDAIIEMERLKKENFRIVIISASGQKWVRSLFHDIPIKPNLILGSKLKYFLGGLIFSSYNCREKMKLFRIKELGLDTVNWERGYSDHPDDIPFLKLCKSVFVISPKKKNIAYFEKNLNDYKILKWKRLHS